MCQSVEITVTLEGRVQIFPTDCDDGGRTCRTVSSPYQALGRVVDDLDLGTSHVVAIELEVTDRAALEDAAERCGLVAVNTFEFDWYGRYQADYQGADAAYRAGIDPAEYGKCTFALVQQDSPLGKAELAARAKGERLTSLEADAIRVREYGKGWRNSRKPYSIGVIEQPGGGYRLAYDNWQGGYGLRDKVGADVNKLKQAYGVEAVRHEARRQRQQVVSEVPLEDGSVRIMVRVPRQVGALVG